MRKLLLIVVACAGLAGAAAPPSEPAPAQNPCGIPDRQPLWIDFADGSVPFWKSVFARPGIVAAASNQLVPPQLRSAGASTVYFDLYLNNRVGTPSVPADPAKIVDRANVLFDRAVLSSGCDHPFIALNELFGASLPTPLTPTSARYRSNVLTFVQQLSARGARPFVLVSSRPYVGGDAADWWRTLAGSSDLVLEVYFSAPRLHKLGASLGSRKLRNQFRSRLQELIDLGIPPSRLGLMLGFQTAPGTGGRERLQPKEAWFDVVKWQALAAKQVAAELKPATVWSWGWAVWSAAAQDPDKPAAACVYLWTRNRSLCDAPAMAGPRFDTSLTAGQVALGPGVVCAVGGQRIRDRDVAALARVAGDSDVALSVLLQRAVLAEQMHVTTNEILAAERGVIAQRFRGSRAAYLAALSLRRATVPVARAVLADELRRLRLSATLRVGAPTGASVLDAYTTYRDALVRQVDAAPAAPWLADRTSGLALEGFAPAQVFGLPPGAYTVRTARGVYRVRLAHEPVPLSALEPAAVTPLLRHALIDLARLDAFHGWIAKRMDGALDRTDCRGDQLPDAQTVDLTAWLPFLGLDGG